MRDAVCQVVVDAGVEVRVPDVLEDDRIRGLPGVTLMEARSWIGVPVTDAAGFVLGTLCGMDAVVREWTDEQAAGLRELAAVLGRTVELRAVAAALGTYAGQAEELAVTLQQVLLPAWIPRVSGVEIATRFQPGGTGAEVLGDFYDVLVHDDGFSVVIGDVAGKGPSAARTASLARSTVRTAAAADQDPVAVLTTVHEVLRGDDTGPRRFVTAAYASFERGPRAAGGSAPWDVVVCSAGHPPGFVVGADGALRSIRAGGRALGATAEPAIDGDAFALRPGESLVLYTDGLTDDDESLGVRLDEDGAQHALAVASSSAEQLADGLIAASRRHTGRRGDDLAVVVISIR